MTRRIAAALLLALCAALVSAQAFPEGAARGRTDMAPPAGVVDIPAIDLQIREPETGREVAFSIQLLLLITVITLAPSILLLMTCFLRLSIVLDFIKRALSLQQVPPTAVLNGIAFFMTLFIMWPTFRTIYDTAFTPLSRGEIGLTETFTRSEAPLREFMYLQMTRDGRTLTDSSYNAIATFMAMGGLPAPDEPGDVPTYVLIPAYILHELTVAFEIGIMLYLPFIIIDMVVASVLMSMGMIMLPPMQISMPFKLMLFVLVDGWNLLTQQLFAGIAR